MRQGLQEGDAVIAEIGPSLKEGTAIRVSPGFRDSDGSDRLRVEASPFRIADSGWLAIPIASELIGPDS